MNKTDNSSFLQKEAYQIRKDILDISHKSRMGHIAPALSIADIITVLYHGILNVSPHKTDFPDRDRFILSKGHAALALYSALYRKKFISRKTLSSFCTDKSILGVHPDFNPEIGIEFTTGSLGHGLSVGAGIALGIKKAFSYQTSAIRQTRKDSGQARMTDKLFADKRQTTNDNLPRVFVLISDAELNEGSNWEAVMFAAQHKLNNLIVIVDDNGNQAYGHTKDVLNIQPIERKFRTFGWNTYQVNGHDRRILYETLTTAKRITDKPSVIIAQTIAGHGVSFMQGSIDWHYWPIDKKQYKKALEDIMKA